MAEISGKFTLKFRFDIVISSFNNKNCSFKRFEFVLLDTLMLQETYFRITDSYFLWSFSAARKYSY